MQKLKCLIIASFGAREKRIHYTISRAIQEFGIQVLHIDQLQEGVILTNAIIEVIDSSDFIGR